MSAFRRLSLAVPVAGVLVAGAALITSGGAAARVESAPKTVRASKIPASKPPFAKVGTVVASSSLEGDRVFSGGSDGYALADLNRGGGAQYPAHTTNGGKTWRVAGPYLHVNAADAPDAIGGVDVISSKEALFFGGPALGNDVDTTTNAGGAWYRARFYGAVEAVNHVGRILFAFLAGHPAVVYSSADGGRVWELSTSAAS